ncbi:hypothetical protein EXE53_16445 [Halorubrum sp. SD626R]|nr:hypothetical protein EXE53_16445 [Halorubrum sp. SD626R]
MDVSGCRGRLHLIRGSHSVYYCVSPPLHQP